MTRARFSEEQMPQWWGLSLLVFFSPLADRLAGLYTNSRFGGIFFTHRQHVYLVYNKQYPSL